MYRFLFLIPLLVLALFPDSASAQLVTCSGEGGVMPDGTVVGNPCGTCEFISTVKNVLGYITLLASIIATITLVYAGLRLTTSGGSAEAKSEAKQALWNIVLGLFFIIAAFAIVDAVMRALVTHESLLTWNEVECVHAIKPSTAKVNLPITELIYVQNRFSCKKVGSSFDCSEQEAYCDSIRGESFIDGDATSRHVNCKSSVVGDGSVGSGGRGVAQCEDDNANCSIEMLKSLGLTDAQADVMSCVAVTENAGKASGCSGTGPCGTFQITKTNWRIYTKSIPGCTEADFGGSIVKAQNNGVCNAKVMTKMVQASGYQPWTGEHGGVPWNRNARKCVNNYASGNSTPRGF